MMKAQPVPEPEPEPPLQPEPPPQPERLVTSTQAARMLNVSTTTLYRARLAGLITYRRTSTRGNVLYTQQALADYAVLRERMAELGLRKPPRKPP